jgi:magnesium-protoporphyrin O-methyltransferase
VPSCCSPGSYVEVFGAKQARRDARRYRRKGLDKLTRRLVDRVVARGVAGASVLEGGGGVGAIEIELLERGATRATNIELSSAYEREAGALLSERGLAGRVERRVGDFVADDVDAADVVVLHRVVCCYPDHRALVGAAADHATRMLALTLPRERALTRIGFRAINLFLRARHCGFRTFVHPVAEILDAARAHGLQLVVLERSGPIWQIAVLERS